MMKDGRPYSIENGTVDAALITAHPQQEIDAVFSWIDENISPRKTPLLSHTSYGLKHILESDIGIYLTNNEFKDAISGPKKAVDETKEAVKKATTIDVTAGAKNDDKHKEAND